MQTQRRYLRKANGDLASPVDGEEAGAAVHEHSDTWGFSWMPAIEEFVEQCAQRAQGEHSGGSDTDPGDEKESPGQEESRGEAGNSGRDHAGIEATGGCKIDTGRSGRKRRRPQTSRASPSRRAPRPPSYNETLLADKSFRNPYASDTMADAFGIVRPTSFVLNVGTDDRTWGGAAAAAAAQATPDGAVALVTAEAEDTNVAEGADDVGHGDRSWFYDTVRDRQNRLWADTRVRKGVELARKGQHQVGVELCVAVHCRMFLSG